MVNVLANSIYICQRQRETLTFILSHVSAQLVTVSAIFILFLALFWSSLTAEENIWFFSCKTLHYVTD